MADEQVETQAVGNFQKQLKVKDLLATHNDYDMNRKEWHFCMALYEGIREVIRLGLIEKHEREPKEAYERRMKELYGLGYTKSIVEIFQHHLFKKTPQGRKLDKLHKDELWKLFYEDADLYGNSYESTMMDIALYAAVAGHMGLLIDKAQTDGKNVVSKQQQIDNKIYPYVAKYFPDAIMDWKWERDEYNRPVLTFLKVRDDTDDGRQYRFWNSETWEVWELPRDKEGEEDDTNDEAEAVFVAGGSNPVGRVPFVWHYNFKSRKQGIGTGDVHEVSRIDLSIIRNLSQIEEIINFAAFPMMRKPMRDAKPTDMSAPQQDDEVSVQAVLEFDPEHPESKPDWLEAKVQEPVVATWDFIIGKIAEIYRAANIGGMAATEPTKSPQSGVAKRVDFQLLASKLTSKAINLENTENKVLEYWLRWENRWDELKDKVTMAREKQFDIEDLATDLENALTAQTLVLSKKFKELLQKQSARQALPSVTEQDLAVIDKEIEDAVAAMPDKPGGNLDDDLDDDARGFVDEGSKRNAEQSGGEVKQTPEDKGGDDDAKGNEGQAVSE